MSITATTDSGDVNCLATLSDCLFVAGSMDGSLRFFDSDEGRASVPSNPVVAEEYFFLISSLLSKRSTNACSGMPAVIPSLLPQVAAVVAVVLSYSYIGSTVHLVTFSR